MTAESLGRCLVDISRPTAECSTAQTSRSLPSYGFQTTKKTLRIMMKQSAGLPIILVVEDVEETRDGIEKMLTADGYRANPARDEEDAIRRACQERPNLILVSLGGRSIDVIGTARRVRDRAELTERVPVVIFSIETIAEGAEVGIGENIYLTRPENFDQLRRFLGRLLHEFPAAS